MNRRIISIIVFTILVIGGLLGIINVIFKPGIGYIIRDPIRINQNSDFPTFGFPGSGTNTDPWIIEDYDIDGGGYGYCIYIGNTTDYFVVRNCFLHNASGNWNWPYFTNTGINLYNVQYGRIENNIGSSNVRYGICLSSSSNNIINNNTLYSNSYHGIYLNPDCIDNIIVNNTSRSNTYDGISIVSSISNDVINNTAYGNRYGVFFSSSNSNFIANNTIYSNREDGIYALSSSNNKIVHNNVSLNDQCGIYISTFSNNNFIANNIASTNSNSGIYIRSSSNTNTIVNNTVSSNLIGIYIEAASNNIIYHNNLIYNTIQADDNMNNNFWDDGYPSGGNYWSDYGGIDNFKGPNQDILGSDGIGDTNYTIDSDSKDNYPLMNPIWNYILLHKGWNLISIPFIQSDTNVYSVLSPIIGFYNTIQCFNASDISDHWEHNHTSKPSNMNDFNDIDHTKGFWIYITEPSGILFQYNGTPSTEKVNIILQPGWNLVGYPSLSRYNRTQALNNLTFDTHVDAILMYNAATQKWKKLGPSDYFTPGKGYWVHAKVKCEWEVPL